MIQRLQENVKLGSSALQHCSNLRPGPPVSPKKETPSRENYEGVFLPALSVVLKLFLTDTVPDPRSRYDFDETVSAFCQPQTEDRATSLVPRAPVACSQDFTELGR